MKDLTELEFRMLRLDERLRAIARRPVDITSPNWVADLRQRPHPLDEAGVRGEAETLLADLVQVYEQSEEGVRGMIRKWFADYGAFAWAAAIPGAPTTEANFRRHLILFSMNNLGADTRDAILVLQDLCRQARAAGVDVVPVLRAVAEMSGVEDRFGMGSARLLLLKATG